MFVALARRHRLRREQATEHQEYLFGKLTAMVANTGFRGWKDKVLTAQDFMPSYQLHQAAEQEKPKRRNRQAIANNIRRVMAVMMAQQNGSASQ